MDSTHHQGSIGPTGRLGLTVIRADGTREVLGGEADPRTLAPPLVPGISGRELLHHGFPREGLSDEVNDWRVANCRRLLRPFAKLWLARVLRIPHFFGRLSLVVIRADQRVLDYGLASLRLVTNTGAGFVVDAFQNLVEVENMKFHGLGTGAVAEAATDTALGTELALQYNPDNTRATGSTTELSAQVYRTVGTNTVDAAVAVTEHGILSQAATGGGVLLDRSVFAVVNLANGDSLQTTYDLTVNSGG